MYYGIYVYKCTIMQVGRYAWIKLCIYASMQKYTTLTVWKYASKTGMSVCKLENIFVHMYACMHICKYQICKYTILQLYECGSMLVYKYEKMHVCM